MENWLTPLVLGLAAATQGFLGFGFGIVAMGILSLLHDPRHAAGVVNLVGLLQTSWLAWALRHSIHWPVVRRILPPTIIGIAVGLMVLGQLSVPILMRILGLTIVAIALWSLLQRPSQKTPSPRWDAPVGFASGLLTGMFNTGGPPLIALVYRRPDPPPVLIATLQAIFVCQGLIRLPGAFAMEMLTDAVWRDAALSAAFVVGGVWGGLAMGRRVSPERFRRASWIALALLGIVVAWAG